MNEKQSSSLWQASIGNDAGIHDETTAANATIKPKLASADLLNKVVLLVDSNPRTRESRAKVLRTMGVTVHSAANAASARARLENSRFNLILVDLGRDVEGAESLVAEIRLKNHKQRVAFLVGKPLYVASALRREVSAPPAAVKVPFEASETPALTEFGKRIKDAERASSF